MSDIIVNKNSIIINFINNKLTCLLQIPPLDSTINIKEYLLARENYEKKQLCAKKLIELIEKGFLSLDYLYVNSTLYQINFSIRYDNDIVKLYFQEPNENQYFNLLIIVQKGNNPIIKEIIPDVDFTDIDSLISILQTLRKKHGI